MTSIFMEMIVYKNNRSVWRDEDKYNFIIITIC